MSTTSPTIEGADKGWAVIEFEDVDLGDARLEKRLWSVAEDLSRQPEYPINQASHDAAATKAAYRLFDNEKVTPERIFAVHRKRSLERMHKEPVVLAIQDTSFFNFSSHKKTNGLGPIGDRDKDAQGLILHSTLAVTPRGLPLGVLSHRCWAREGYRASEEEHERKPIEEKESYRWIATLREVASLSLSHGKGMVVTIADRESDIYEFLLEAQKLNASYVIRACYDRHVRSPVHRTIQDHMDELSSQAKVEVEVPTQNRRALLDLKFTRVDLRPPERITRAKNAFIVTCWAIRVAENAPPDGWEPLSWTLLTNIPIGSAAQAVEKLSWYRRRWSIEEFHKILKSGCSVEDCRLQTAERLKRYFALFCVIAWRLFWMVHIKRAAPDAPAEVALTQSEIGTLCSLKRFKQKLPPASPTVRQALIAIACLGGYLNRKNDPPPGPTVMWRGWQRLASMTELYESVVPGCG
jgi:Transposase DNA-binding/Transposase Tn5 dimerisation domain